MTALDLSKYIVSKCVNDGCPISNLQLQKILYYIQKECLQTRNEVMFYDDIEAWQFGPVVPNVYYYFCGFGAMPISSPFLCDVSLNDKDSAIVDNIVKNKRTLDPWEMVNETHKRGGAWDNTYKDGNGNRSIIPIELIKAER